MTSSQPDGAGSSDSEDLLEKFRQQWRDELKHDKQRAPPRVADSVKEAAIVESTAKLGHDTALATSKVQSTSALTVTASPSTGTAEASTSSSSSKQQPKPSKSTAQQFQAEQQETDVQDRGFASGPSPQQKDLTAVELYANAVDAEREGRLNDALKAYRLAFRKDENVDKTYHRLQMATKSREDEKKASTEEQTDDLVFTFQRTLQLEPDYERQKQLKGRMFTSNYVERLLTSFRENPYIPEWERVNSQLEVKGKRKEKDGDLLKSRTNPKMDLAESKLDMPLVYHPRREGTIVRFARLPDEIVLHILSFVSALSPNAQYPDMRSLERGFGLVSRKARVLTLQSSALWKHVCQAVYRPPFLLEGGKKEVSEESDLPAGLPAHQPLDKRQACLKLAEQKYSLDWRLMWIEQPRLRFDGVYISQITYLRKGAAEGSYYDPTHVVTYYRYLVFLPTGDVVSLLSHDIPSNIVPNLLNSTQAATGHERDGSSREKGSAASKMPQSGFTVGKWRLLNVPAASVAGLEQKEGKNKDADNSAAIVQLSSLEDPRVANVSDIKYSFKMICRLKSTTRGKMNKLEMLQLLARNHRTGEEAPIPVKQLNGNMPSFYFSRVLSYD